MKLGYETWTQVKNHSITEGNHLKMGNNGRPRKARLRRVGDAIYQVATCPCRAHSEHTTVGP